MSRQDYEATLPALNSIHSDAVKIPDIPVDVYLQEAENLFLIAQEDKVELIAAGLNWEKYGNDLPLRTGALRYAQSVRANDRISQSATLKKWKEQLSKGKKLRADLLVTFRYAFRKHPELISKIREVAKGSGEINLIQSLSDLSVLGEANPKELAIINFEMGKLSEAVILSGKMADLHARAIGEQSVSDNKDKRDRSFTLLKEAVNEIRITGKFVFRNDRERARLYASAYKRLS